LLYTVRSGVPFICYTDHDVAGFHIYLTLKYGSRRSAWAAPSMICPTLQWGGPNKQQVLQHVRRYAYNQYMTSLSQKHPQWSTEKPTGTVNDWLEERLARPEKEMYKTSNLVPKICSIRSIRTTISNMRPPSSKSPPANSPRSRSMLHHLLSSQDC